MPRGKEPKVEPKAAILSTSQAREGIKRLQRRVDELEKLDVGSLTNDEGGHELEGLRQKIKTTIREIYGTESVEYHELSWFSLSPHIMSVSSAQDTSIRANIPQVRNNIGSAISRLKILIEMLQELVGDDDTDPAVRSLKAYEGLQLHGEIARACTSLYRDGYYDVAIEHAVKALNGLVKLRSDLELDGSNLMERAFNPSKPVLRFNALADQSDKDEQKGFMMMFSGAVAGLRNPRAHGFIKDNPERALEFIAYVSLLAKLLDEATKV